MFIIRWPDGTVPRNGLLYSSEGAWTGLEYPFAGQCLYAGLNDIALQGEYRLMKAELIFNIFNMQAYVNFSGNFSLD
jgi:hypothetical protein